MKRVAHGPGWIAAVLMLIAAAPLAAQDSETGGALTPSRQDTPPAAARPDPDLIATKLTGEPDPCARREMIINQQVTEMTGRFENLTPEDVAEFRRIASDMYQASHDMSRPRGVPPVDFATACPVTVAPSPQRTDPASE